MASSFMMRFLDHTQRRTTVGRTPLDEWSARRRDLYLTTHNIHNRQTSKPPAGFEPTISAGERPHTYALGRSATGTGTQLICVPICKICPMIALFLHGLILYIFEMRLVSSKEYMFNTLRTGDADLRFYITTVQDGWSKSAFLTRAFFPCTVHLIMQYIEPVSEWSCWRMFIETWPHSELPFRQHASSI